MSVVGGDLNEIFVNQFHGCDVSNPFRIIWVGDAERWHGSRLDDIGVVVRDRKVSGPFETPIATWVMDQVHNGKVGVLGYSEGCQPTLTG